jgi:hypothetical protein
MACRRSGWFYMVLKPIGVELEVDVKFKLA